MIAFFFFFWFLAPILYCKYLPQSLALSSLNMLHLDTNTFFAKFLPMSASIAFDNTGLPYDPSVIIQGGTFNQEAYQAYSPMFLPITIAIAYGLAFASITSVIVHTFCEQISKHIDDEAADAISQYGTAMTLPVNSVAHCMSRRMCTLVS